MAITLTDSLTQDQVLQNVANFNPEMANNAMDKLGYTKTIPGVGGAVTKQGFLSQDGTTPITADNLTPTSPLVLPQTPVLTGASGLAERATSYATSAQSQSQAELDRLQKAKETGASDIASLVESIGGQGTAKVQAYEDTGLLESKKSIDKIRSDMEAKNLATRRQIEQIQNANPTGMIGAGAQGEISRIERENASYQADQAITLSALNRDFETAKSFIDAKIDAETEGLKAQLEAKKFFYEENKDTFSKKEQRQHEADIKASDRVYEAEKTRLKDLADLDLKAIEKGIVGAGLSAVRAAKTKDEKMLAIAENMPLKSGTDNATLDNERALLAQFNSQPIIKDYNQVVSQKLKVDRIISNGVGGPADLALIFSFMKGLDPNSVVRESEYEAAAQSGNIFQGIYAKFNGYFKEKGGKLPQNVREEFQNLVNQSVLAQQDQYENIKKSYENIAIRQGLNPENVVLDLSKALKTAEGQQKAVDAGIAQFVLPNGTVVTLQADGTYK